MSRKKLKAIYIYIINEVKRIRINFGVTQLELSAEINDTPGNNLVGSAESNSTTISYNDHHLNVFANYFTYLASKLDDESLKENGLKKEYKIEDFYPQEPITESIVEKDIAHYPKGLFPSGAIFVLIEEKNVYLNEWRTIKEICDFCNKEFDKEWKQSDFTRILLDASSAGKIMRFNENIAKYKQVE